MSDSLKQSAFTILICLIVLSAAVLLLANAFHLTDKPDSVDSGDSGDSRGIISFESGIPDPTPTSQIYVTPSTDIDKNIMLPSDMTEPTITQDHKPVVRYPPPAMPIVNGSRPEVV